MDAATGAGAGAGRGSMPHPELGQVNYTLTPVSADPDGQVADTISLMRGYVLSDCQTEPVQRALREALGGRDPRRVSQQEIISRVFDYVKGRVRYTRDENISQPWMAEGADVIEALVRPVDMVFLTTGERGPGSPIGDCDDFSMLTSCLLACAGVENSFVTLAADDSAPDRYSHVYVAAYTDAGERIALDTSHGPAAGWEAPDRFGKCKDWPVVASGMRSLYGGAGWLIAAALAGAAVYYIHKGGVRW